LSEIEIYIFFINFISKSIKVLVLLVGKPCKNIDYPNSTFYRTVSKRMIRHINLNCMDIILKPFPTSPGPRTGCGLKSEPRERFSQMYGVWDRLSGPSRRNKSGRSIYLDFNNSIL